MGLVDKIEKEAIVNRWLLSNPPVLKTTVLKAQEDIAKLLNYINELENMPLVKAVQTLQKENERLRKAIVSIKEISKIDGNRMLDNCYIVAKHALREADEYESQLFQL